MVRRGPWAGYLFSQHSLPLLPLDPPFPSIPPPTQPSDCCISDFRGNTNHTCGVRTVLSLLSDTSLPELHSLSCSCAFFFAAPPPVLPRCPRWPRSFLFFLPSLLLPLPPPLHPLLSLPVWCCVRLIFTTPSSSFLFPFCYHSAASPYNPLHLWLTPKANCSRRLSTIRSKLHLSISSSLGDLPLL